MDSLVKWCKKENIYVMLDMHCAPAGQTGDNIDDSYGYPFLFESEEAQELTINIWKQIAAHYANEPTIMGYDLLNEPIPPFFDTAFFNPRLEPLYKKITAAVRAVDKKHIIFLGVHNGIPISMYSENHLITISFTLFINTGQRPHGKLYNPILILETATTSRYIVARPEKIRMNG